MSITMNLAGASNQFNSSPIVSTAGASKVKGAFLNAGEEKSEVAGKDMDTFTERLANAFKTDNADVIRALDELSESDKMEIAMKSYLQMQGRIYSARNTEESDIKAFRELEGEKGWYKDLLKEADENGGQAKIKDDPYSHFLFSDKKPGSSVSAREIEKALDDVQGRIDNFLAPYGRNEDGSAISSPGNEGMTRDYIAYASAFEEVTGLKADCLDPGDKLFRHKLDRTEENFVQKAQENIDALKAMSDDLHDLMKRYKGELDEEVGGGSLSEEARARMEAFEFVREQFITGNDAGSLNSLGLLDAKA